MKKFTTIGCTPKTLKVLRRVSAIKRWKTSELLEYLALLFLNGLDMLDDESVSIQYLRELYGNWQLSLHPYGVGRETNE